MRQASLFDSGDARDTTRETTRDTTRDITKDNSTDQSLPWQHSHTNLNEHQSVSFYPDFSSWYSAALHCLQAKLPPGAAWWSEDRTTKQITRKNTVRIQPEFQQKAHAASCHSGSDRWALLYSLLWRLHHTEPQLMELAGDPEVAKLHRYAKAVSRDVHKMKAFVRFRKVEDEIPRYVAWFEPQHFIIEYAAPFFKRRFANMHWSILSPVGCAHWEAGGELWFSDAVEQRFAPAADQFEDAWRVYYKSIFNPARLKTTAMQSEMPKKYWKNLPEAQEIPSLVASAQSRTREMIAQQKDQDTLRCGRRPSSPDQQIVQQLQQVTPVSLQSLQLQASLCQDCPQGDVATQTVFGNGPENARIMIVGEQPGDQEDLHGKPFVGPAGKVLRAALMRAGIEAEDCYLTNAVKHFGFVPRGKKRIHKRPEASVVSVCGQWLKQEMELVNPEVVIYLGTTAATTAFGSQVKIQRDRGRLIAKDGRQHLITIHPSSVLRIPRGPAQQKAYLGFINDLKLSVSFAEVVE